MVAELGDLKSADEAAVWVHKNLPVKNTLTSADAELVEAKFRERLAVIEGGQSGAAPREAVAVPGGERRQGQSEALRSRGARSCSDRRSAPPRRGQDHSSARHGALQIRRHAAVRRLRPHARGSPSYSPRALNRKVSDEFTVPVCRLHHRELHRYGDEASWWAGANVDPLPIALELCGHSRGDAVKADPELLT
jgi:hypothetical protein